MESLTTFICDKLPSVVARYDILEEIDRGGQAAVLRVRERHSKAERALKISLDFDGRPETLARFEREARVLVELDHPNIVGVREYGSENNIPYMVMDKVSGKSLEAIVKQSLSAENEVPEVDWTVDTFRDIAEALAHSHSRGVYHRDVKPDNVLIETTTGQPILIDFGIAKRDRFSLSGASSEDMESLTKTGEVVGTPAFMSPEQLDVSGAHGEVSEKSDVWSFGATLFYCLTGRPPFGEKVAGELFGALMNSSPDRVSRFNSEVPHWLDRLCAACLTTSPHKRPAMKTVIKTLEEEGLKTGVSKFKGMILLALVTSLLYLTISFSHLYLDPIALETMNTFEVWVNTDSYTFVGQSNRSETTFTFGAMEVLSNDEGMVEIRLPLKEGENRIPIRVVGTFTGGFSRELIVHRDTKPPEFILGPVLEEGALKLKKGAGLSGHVSDASPIKLFYNDHSVPVDEKGAFRLGADEISQSATGAVLKAVDEAGNEARLRVTVPTSWRVPEILENLGLWVVASRSAKKAAAAQVADHLKGDFDFIGMKNFRCGAVKYRLASYKHKKSGLVLRLIPGGRFLMGSSSDRGGVGAVNTMPVHPVTVRPFLVGAREVSWGVWYGVRPQSTHRGWKKTLPVEKQLWQTVKDWLAVAGGQLRLPSEAEWEYACRGGTTTQYFWGEKLDDKYCWTTLNTGETSRSVILHDHSTNAFGLSDMIGNVAEWCEDSYLANYKNAPGNENPRKILNEVRHVARGGSYKSLWSSFSAGRSSHYRNTTAVGFRVFRSLP